MQYFSNDSPWPDTQLGPSRDRANFVRLPVRTIQSEDDAGFSN